MPHAVLLGDSIFDNAAYVRGGPDVVRQLREALPAGWEATLLARDGAVIDHVRTQLAHLPGGATHLVVSMGGNDLLAVSDVVHRPASTVADALDRLASLAAQFEATYRRTLAPVLETGLPTVLCTVYNGAHAERERTRHRTALAVFNDVILRAALEAGLPAIELRAVCSEDAHYANPIEPSVQGGARIAAAIARVVREHDFARRNSAVYA